MNTNSNSKIKPSTPEYLGIYPDLSNEEYHEHTESISRSALMEYKKSPYNYWAKYINNSRPFQESTPAMIFGSAFHSLILEPENFDEYFAVVPEQKLLKDVGREEYELYKKQVSEIKNSNKRIISDENLNSLFQMREALWNHSEAIELIQDGKYEQSFFWKDEDSGLTLKSRPDIMHHNMIVDIKTCSDASSHAFQNSMVFGGYHIQGAMIQEGWKNLTGNTISTVINIAIEKTYPYCIGIYIIDEYALDVGRKEFKKLCSDLKSSMINNKWGNYSPQVISLPNWSV